MIILSPPIFTSLTLHKINKSTKHNINTVTTSKLALNNILSFLPLKFDSHVFRTAAAHQRFPDILRCGRKGFLELKDSRDNKRDLLLCTQQRRPGFVFENRFTTTKSPIWATEPSWRCTDLCSCHSSPCCTERNILKSIR